MTEETLNVTVEVHFEDGHLWAQVVEYPGCFATGDTPEELAEALQESLSLYLSEPDHQVVVQVQPSETLTAVKRVPVRLALV